MMQIKIQQFNNMQLITFFMIIVLMASKNIPQQFIDILDIDSSIRISPRYATEFNFIGKPVNGYFAKKIIITRRAAIALSNVQTKMRQQGYQLVIYDAYRPQKAVNNFIQWSQSPEDQKTKKYYYPFIDKTQIIPQGYVAKKSGHSRGSTVDLSYIRKGSQLHKLQERQVRLADGSKIIYLDDGTVYTCSHFDFFGDPSHHNTKSINDPECLQNRAFLKRLMQQSGFRALEQQWWHYTLINEPFPDTYFDFDII